MIKKVKTVTYKDLDNYIEELYKNLKKDNIINPSYIISILNGGAYIGNKLYNLYKTDVKSKNIKKINVKLSRNTTKHKEKKLINFLFKILPYSILNILRVIEDFSRSRKYFLSKNSNFFERNLKELELINFEKISKERPIIIVDDAVDTGKTIYYLKNYLRKLGINNDNIIIVAIVKTQKNPLIKVDYYIFENILIRFPWSKDFKSRR